VSKGLEFDIVFLLGVAKRNTAKQSLIPEFIDKKETLVPCDTESEGYKYYCEELDSEKIRQLYVGMTRAKYRLYVPVALNTDHKELSLGTASPIELYLSGQCYEEIQHYDLAKVLSFLKDLSQEASISHTYLPKHKFKIEKWKPEDKSQKLCLPARATIRTKEKVISSFSSIYSGGGHSFDGLEPPMDWKAEEKTPHTIPAGSGTGVIIHELFEKIPIDALQESSESEDLIPFVESMLSSDEQKEWSGAFSELLYNTFNIPLQGKERDFLLKDLDPTKVWHEMEFLYPEDSNEFKGLMKGFIDLIFEHEGYYYIVDWKSNWLGNTPEDYSEDKIEKVMDGHHYSMQAKIYETALEAYLKNFDDRPFRECHGGTFYLFVRGISLEKNTNTAIYKIQRDVTCQVLHRNK
jgi:exodeoxyribonuclease V beta subunit